MYRRDKAACLICLFEGKHEDRRNVLLLLPGCDMTVGALLRSSVGIYKGKFVAETRGGLYKK